MLPGSTESDVSAELDASTSPAGTVASASGDTEVPCEPEPVMGECSVACQDCPAAEKCTVGGPTPASQSFDRSLCVPVSPAPAEQGESCVRDEDGYGDDCDKRLICVAGPDGAATCEQICSPFAHVLACEDVGQRCRASEAERVAPTFGVCLVPCDPLEPCDKAGDRLCHASSPSCDLAVDPSCYPLSEDATTVCTPFPQFTEDHAHGWPCTEQHDCDRQGWMCAPAAIVAGCSSGAGCCTELCDMDDAEPDSFCSFAPSGETCTPLFEVGSEPPGVFGVGICRLE
jgi:hypothetical protein